MKRTNLLIAAAPFILAACNGLLRNDGVSLWDPDGGTLDATSDGATRGNSDGSDVGVDVGIDSGSEGGVDAADASCSPDATQCNGPVPQTCGPKDIWVNGTVTAGVCNAACTPGQSGCGWQNDAGCFPGNGGCRYLWSAQNVVYIKTCSAEGQWGPAEYCQKTCLCTFCKPQWLGYFCLGGDGTAQCVGGTQSGGAPVDCPM